MIVLSWPIVRLVQQLHSPYNVRSRHCTGSIEAILHPSSPSYSFPTTQSTYPMQSWEHSLLLSYFSFFHDHLKREPEGYWRTLSSVTWCFVLLQEILQNMKSQFTRHIPSSSSNTLPSTTAPLHLLESGAIHSHSIFIFKHSSVNDCSSSSGWKWSYSSRLLPSTECMTTKENDCKYIFMCVVSVWWKNRLDKHVFNGDGRVKIERCWVDWLELLELWREVDRNRRRASCVGDIGG